MSAADFWEQRYSSRERIWSGRPNAVLVDIVEPLPAGRALDLGCGEGGDSVWLAERGWQVTAVDISATAVERTAALAARAGVSDRVVAERHDLGASLPAGRFDLVSAQFFQSPVELPRERILRAAAAAIEPGGLLLIVDHAAAPPWSDHKHAEFPTPEETLAGLELDASGWETMYVGTREREATGPKGEHGTLLDGVIALRRR